MEDMERIALGAFDCLETNSAVDARSTRSKDFGLRHIGQRSESDRRVELKASSSEAWPDGDWCVPCAPHRAAFSDELVFRLASTYDTFLCSIIRNSTAPRAQTGPSMIAALDLRLT